MEHEQPAVFFVVVNERLPLDHGEARELVAKLREPDTGNPHLADAQAAAAVFIERLIDEPDASNPPLTARELRTIGLALIRLEISEGLSDRQADLRDALLHYERTLAVTRDVGADALICSECRRGPAPGEALDRWRYRSDGVGELHAFCPGCDTREFGGG